MDEPDLYGTRARERRGSGGIVLLALLVAFLLGAALTAYGVRRWQGLALWLHPMALPQPVLITPPQPLRAPSTGTATAAGPDEPLADRVDEIEAKVDAIDRRAAEASGDADRAERLLVAFAARRALDRGQPLGYLEGLLRDRFGKQDAPAVALIIASAQKPVLLSGLQDQLAALGPTLVAFGPHESWWAGVKRELGSLFVVRRAEVPSPAPAERLARATRALEQGQVDTAAAEVARMPGAARAQDWLAEARRYVLARGALDRIETDALLAPPEPPAPVDG